MAKTEPKTILKVYSTVESKLPTLPLEDGQLIFVYDKKKIILDNRGVRTVYEQIQTIETEEQRNDLLAPIDSFYFVIETSILWRYTNGHWNQITTSPQEQIDRIVAEGTKQVKAVRDEGQKVLQSIPEDFQTQMETKLNKQQGIENKGKVLVIGEDGNVSPGEVQSGGGDGIAIINTMSGESPLAIPDSAERVNKRLELGGKTEQVQTTGVNLFDEKLLLDFDSENYDKTQSGSEFYYYKFPVSGTVTVSTKNANKHGEYLTVGIKPDGSDKTWLSHGSAAISKYKTLTPEEGNIYLGVNNNLERVESMIQNTGGIIINEGSVAKPYEPYTGGKPSPSPEYPQEIKNVGKWNEGTQKYEVDVKITGKNLLNLRNPSVRFDRCILQEDGSIKSNIRSNYYFCSIYVDDPYVVDNIKNDQAITFSIGKGIQSRTITISLHGERVGSVNYQEKSSVPGGNSVSIVPSGFKKVSKIELRFNRSGSLFTDTETVVRDFMIHFGESTPYQPYKEQTLTLTSDRPITKWDRLVEQGGEIGWLYGGKIAKDFSVKSKSTDEEVGGKNRRRFKTTLAGKFSKSNNVKCNFASTDTTNSDYGIGMVGNGDVYLYFFADTKIETIEQANLFLASLSEKIIEFESESTEFIPLPQSEQNAIRALKTYYPTTVITADGGELDPDIKATYTADTKNYIDNKFGKTINAMQTKLLELESRV